MSVFADGTGVTEGTQNCRCGADCEFPCWQRLGIAPACRACGCGPLDVDDAQTHRASAALSDQRATPDEPGRGSLMGRMPPWTTAEVANINRWQAADAVHPLTCPTHSPLRLMATEEAIVCPACDYRQTWVPTAMTRELPPFAELSEPQQPGKGERP